MQQYFETGLVRHEFAQVQNPCNCDMLVVGTTDFSFVFILLKKLMYAFFEIMT